MKSPYLCSANQEKAALYSRIYLFRTPQTNIIKSYKTPIFNLWKRRLHDFRYHCCWLVR